MDVDKKQNKGNDGRPTIDLEKKCLRLLMIGQWRQMELEPLFAYELCSVPPSLIDEQGCLRKSNKSGLVKGLGVLETSQEAAEIVIVDGQQHIPYRVATRRQSLRSDRVHASSSGSLCRQY